MYVSLSISLSLYIYIYIYIHTPQADHGHDAGEVAYCRLPDRMA